MSLWVAAAHPIWQEVDIKAPDAMQQATQRVAGAIDALLQQAQQEGFPAATLPSGAHQQPVWRLKDRQTVSLHGHALFSLLCRVL